MLRFARSLSPDSEAFTIFVTEKYQYKDKIDILPRNDVEKINSFLRALKAKKKGEEISSFDLSAQKKCFIVQAKRKSEHYSPEESGANFYSYLKKYKDIKKVDFCVDSLDFDNDKLATFFSEFLFGMNLKSYKFNKYKTLNKDKINQNVNFSIISSNATKIENKYKYFHAIKEGVFLTRDLVSEPPNVLNPKTYVNEIKKLSRIGLKIKVYNEREMKKLGLNALLGVGQGSVNESYLVTIEWNGEGYPSGVYFVKLNAGEFTQTQKLMLVK